MQMKKTESFISKLFNIIKQKFNNILYNKITLSIFFIQILGIIHNNTNKNAHTT